MLINLLLSFIITASAALHPYHVAVCELDYKADKKAYQVTHKIFTDDLEKGIETEKKVKLLMGNPKQHAETKRLIGEFVQSHFRVKAGGKEVKLVYLGYEVDNDQTFVYFEAKGSKPKKLNISYTLLTDTFDDQSNLVHYNITGKKETLYFNKGTTNRELQF